MFFGQILVLEELVYLVGVTKCSLALVLGVAMGQAEVLMVLVEGAVLHLEQRMA